MAKLSAGSKLGSWTLDHYIGEGGNGVVWACLGEKGERMALKRLKSFLLEPSGNEYEKRKRIRRVKRFLDEIKFLQSHTYTGVIRIQDAYIPEKPTTDNPPWLVMPLGNSLPDYLSEEDRSLRNVVQLFRDLANALVSLHNDGIAHRDIKPDNIILVDRIPFLSDFGLVQYDDKEPNTSESEILGPSFFIAPEMRSGDSAIDGRPADVYSLTKSFWVSATGQKFPLPGEQRLGIPALSLSAYVTDPRAKLLDKLIDNCTRHVPEDRASAKEMYLELLSWSEQQESSSEPIKSVTEIARSMSSTIAATSNEIDSRKQLRSWGAGLMNLASSQLVPLVEALNHFEFVDYEGRPMPSRLLEGEGNMLWDQWTYPNVLVEESGDVVWRGASGTVSQFVQPKGPTVILVTGVRIIVHGKGRVTLCAAHVCIEDAGMTDRETIWQASHDAPAGTATADAALRELISHLFFESPKAVTAFKSMIERAIAHNS